MTDLSSLFLLSSFLKHLSLIRVNPCNPWISPCHPWTHDGPALAGASLRWESKGSRKKDRSNSIVSPQEEIWRLRVQHAVLRDLLRRSLSLPESVISFNFRTLLFLQRRGSGYFYHIREDTRV
ncbi:MAG: hypothetical protein AMJ46_14685 [Latescibacteria bacterium DG_63]|nr:MAG: hypothetical protein AMJ46_14685 [Latescibacteria bacterium DG_63]